MADIDAEQWRQGELAGLLLMALHRCDDLLTETVQVDCTRDWLNKEYGAKYYGKGTIHDTSHAYRFKTDPNFRAAYVLKMNEAL